MKLFGDAISANIPGSLLDASDLREVPDNQEVFVGTYADADISLIVELLEPVKKASIVESLVYHVDEVHRVSNNKPLGEYSLETATMKMGPYEVAERVDFVKERDGYVSLVFALLPLKEFDTDVLITTSIKPQATKPGAEEIDSQKQVLRDLITSFKVLDPKLFGSEVNRLEENGPQMRPQRQQY